MPLVQFDLQPGTGLRGADVLGLNLLKAPSVIDATRDDLLSGNNEWVQWTLKRHAAGSLDLNAPDARPVLPALK